jgi:preprotein translocase subunit SecE
MIEKIKNFFSDVAKEMKKVSWPTKEQLRESSIVVVVATLIFTIFTYLIDWLVTQAIGFIF